jgi:hypothetical protein
MPVIHKHSGDDMDDSTEFDDVTEPVAVVIRPDGSIDAYGYVAVIDQRPAGGIPPSLHVRVMTSDEGVQLVADLPDWPYPIPRVGDYLFHPPYSPGNREDIAGHVKSVGWRTHDRPAEDSGATAFVQTAQPYVKIVI